ncbi:MarR family winged helix-turn-helix transcriptional regulator [Streptacidiphilus sp. PAMC 29251]
MTTTDRSAPRPGTDFTATLLRMSNVVLHELTEVARGYGLTQQQAQLMCALLDGPTGMTALSRQLHLDKSSITGLVDRVARQGLVERQPDPADRRASRIALTDQGQQICASAYDDVAARLSARAADVPPGDRAHALSVLTLMLGQD